MVDYKMIEEWLLVAYLEIALSIAELLRNFKEAGYFKINPPVNYSDFIR